MVRQKPKFEVGDSVVLKSVNEIKKIYSYAQIETLYGKVPYWAKYCGKLSIVTNVSSPFHITTYQISCMGNPISANEAALKEFHYLNFPSSWLEAPIKIKLKLLG